jgi:hypothetical protein
MRTAEPHSIALARSAFALAMASLFTPASASAANASCPDMSGTYRVKGDGPAFADVLEVLNIREAGFTGSRVRIEMKDDRLSIWTSVDNQPFRTQPRSNFSKGSGFTCDGAQVVFGPLKGVGRRSESGFLSGQSIVSIGRTAAKGLHISSNFYGRQQTTIYSYDSANVSIPKLGTGERINNSVIWPDADLPDDLPAESIKKESPKEPKEVEAVRTFLNAKMLGPLILGGVSLRGEKMITVTLTSPSTEAVQAFEKRLNDADVPHVIKRKPIWTNGRYWFEMLINKGLFAPAKP